LMIGRKKLVAYLSHLVQRCKKRYRTAKIAASGLRNRKPA
jgi:hypothetical protein